MTDIPKMVYPHGFYKTRVGAPYGSGHPGHVLGAEERGIDGDRARLCLVHM
jgi:hypothetical protein